MGGSSAPKPPPPTAEEKAMEKRTNLGLRNERKKTETMLKDQARSRLGVKSLLKGIKPEVTSKQEDVKHSKAMSLEERRSYGPFFMPGMKGLLKHVKFIRERER